MQNVTRAEALNDDDLDVTEGGLVVNLSVAMKTDAAQSSICAFGQCACEMAVQPGTMKFEAVTMERGVRTTTHTICDETHL
ncbi:MAG: hypothetical protein AAGD13_17490 [Pseudomonadota bacterium]